MNLLSALASALNVIKKTPSTEKPIITEPTTVVEPVDGSTTLTLTDGGTSRRSLRRHWRIIKQRWPNSRVDNSDRWGMLSSLQAVGGGCKCLACEEKYPTWADGRNHDCEHEKEFRRITGRSKPRRGTTKKKQTRNTAPGSASTGPGVAPNRVGVVENSRGEDPMPGGSAPGGKGEPG